ncbi:MAG: hypothetical protein JHC30_06125 [Caldisericum sp.]|nr:hypothetical protein [Caldisericum sp.]
MRIMLFTIIAGITVLFLLAVVQLLDTFLPGWSDRRKHIDDISFNIMWVLYIFVSCLVLIYIWIVVVGGLK